MILTASGTTTATLDNTSIPTPQAQPGKFYCDVCKVGATSRQQLDMHLQGKNHKKNLTKKQPSIIPLPPPRKTPTTPTESRPPAGVPCGPSPMTLTPAMVTGAIVRAKLTADADRRDYSVFRTPSGQYYCSPCNMSLNSEVQFVQHTESKRHRQSAAVAGRKRKATT